MNPLLSLLKSDKPEKHEKPEPAAAAPVPATTRPHLDSLHPPAAMPGGEIEVRGRNLGPTPTMLRATIGDMQAPVLLARPTRARLQVPEGSIPGELQLHQAAEPSNALPLRVAVPMAENLHPVSNPAVDATGNVYVTVSGARGQQVPVSIFSIQRDLQIRPFVREEILNATGLAFGPDGFLYCSSRAEGTVYRISPTGSVSIYAEGLGIATGLAFDRAGNLFVGDRTGTIFKITPSTPSSEASPAFRARTEESVDSGGGPGIYVHATLEPSMAAYHLAFNAAGTLFMSGPTTSSNQAIYAIDPDGTVNVFYQGLGRAQGMAFDVEGNLYIAASLHGERGIVRITPGPHPQATLAVSGQNLVGLAFLEDGCAALATREALYHVDLGIEGRPLP